jgi:hypothetical protein
MFPWIISKKIIKTFTESDYGNCFLNIDRMCHVSHISNILLAYVPPNIEVIFDTPYEGDSGRLLEAISSYVVLRGRASSIVSIWVLRQQNFKHRYEI